MKGRLRVISVGLGLFRWVIFTTGRHNFEVRGTQEHPSIRLATLAGKRAAKKLNIEIISKGDRYVS